MSEAARIIKRFQAVKQIREPVEKIWLDCFNASYPLRGKGFAGSTLTAESSQDKQSQIMDGVTTESVRVLASSIMSGMTPANSRWFQLSVGNKQTEDEKRWLDAAAQCIFENIHGGNFDAEGFESIIDMVCAGWFCMFIDEDRKRGGIVFEQWPLASVFTSSTRADGQIDTVFREYELSAEQAANEFGLDKLSDKTQKLVDTAPDTRVKFLMLIEPRKMHMVGAKLAKNLPFRQVIIEHDTKNTVKESGFHEFPVVSPRWFKIPDSCLGIGPLSEAMPDSNMLNDIKRMHLASAEMTIAGMWIAEDDGVINPRTFKIGPRKIIIANSVDSIKPLTPGGNWQLAQQEIQNAQAAIRKILMADQLQPQGGPVRSATEVMVQVNLIRQLLGPIYGRLQAEYLQPMIVRCFGLAFRAGALTQPPESLGGKSFSVRYISPLARAAKQEHVVAIERHVQQVTMLGNVDRNVVKIIDAQATARILAEAGGVPPECLRTPADYEEAVAQEQQAMAAAAQQQAMADMATRAAPNIVTQMSQAGAA